MERVEPSGDPQTQTSAMCAVHEGAQSHAVCGRCGNFVCPLCLDDTGPLPDRCAECREREGGGQIAWERDEGNWLGRWWRTTRDVMTRPTDTIERCRPGSTPLALGYAALTAAILGTILGGLGACAVAAIGALGIFDQVLAEAGAALPPGLFYAVLAAVVLIYPILAIIGAATSIVFRTIIFHLTAVLLGARGGFGDSLWSVCYLHAIMLVVLPMLLLQQIPIVGVAVSLLSTLLMETWYALQLTTVARRYHGLSAGRAAMAGWASFLVAVALFTSCCVFFAAVGFMDTW